MIYGKGCVQTPKIIRDKHFRLAATPELVDWSKPYLVQDSTPVLYQGSSSACTAFATASYCMALQEIENFEIEEYSRRYIYSQTSLGPNQGTYIWKAMGIPLKYGCASEQSVPDGTTEEVEIDPSLNGNAVLKVRTNKYAVIPKSNISQMAQVIKSYHGFITGFNGHDSMFAPDGTIIDWSHTDWGHAVRLVGYEVRDGKRYLRFRNSWGSNWGTNGDGFMPEEFVNSGMMFDCYVYASIQDLDTMFQLVCADGKEVWLIKDGKKTHIYNAAALTTIADFSQIKVISQAELNAIPDSGLDLAALTKE